MDDLELEEPTLDSFGAYSADTGGLLSLLGADKLTENLPTKQEMTTMYVEAVVAFWVVGGIAIYLAKSFARR